ncbi:hypothetical protein AAC387_Pa10g0330 [Persea americana]|eukprot:TRINITY_DN12820_c4_g1_i1.p1 TRINITY_DN12820_c4_g1~~TRINITY_DN12820_c4_g1_i1.p1  ORF type:complete len:385 (-),score=61.82 TRINITY_DN12820_c4_g1_i1:422-1576(-)
MRTHKSLLSFTTYAALGALFLLLRVSIVHSQMDSCSLDVSSFLPAPFNDSSSLTCRSVWHTFDLRYSKGQDNVLTIVLSAEYTSGWVGMGFSKDGMMVGSSAMVGWMGKERAHIRQYYLRGQSPSDVVVNQGQLLGTNVPEVVVLNGAKIYLAFQVKFEAPVTRQPLLFAFGASRPSHYRLTEHEDKTSILFDFSAGASSASSYPVQLKRSHGILAIFGWGVLLPVGAIFARYFRQWDPLWYYLHLAIQFLGFLIVLSSLVAGVSLYDKIHANVLAHRGLGIFVFVLLILQVVAFFLRPDEDSKVRRYWNWYHSWVGRLALFLAAVNIVIGIRVGGAGNGWKAGYGFSLAVILITVIVLEVMLWIRGSKKPADPPAFQMHPPPQ